MSIQTINLGAAANDGTGDDARLAGQKINSNFAYLETLLNNAAAAIAGVYDTNADMVADQSNQSAGKLYLVKDARTVAEVTAIDPVYFAIYEYLGGTNSDLVDDYKKLDANETASVISQTGVGVKTVKGIEQTYSTAPIPTFGGVYVYKDGSGNITKFKFDKPYSGFLAKLAANAGSNTYKFVITNKSQGNTLMATISSFTFVDPFYEVSVASGITESELSVDDILDFSLPDIDNVGDLMAGVDSVNTQTGDVVLDADDIDDASTAHKFVTQSQINKLDSIDATHYLPPLQNTTALSALNEADLSDKARVYVEDEQSDYFYDATATSGDIAPDDQTNSTGFWKKVAVGGETAASIKTKYESNANTNAFTDTEKTKVSNALESSDVSTNSDFSADTAKLTDRATIKALFDSKKQEQISGTRLVNATATGSINLDLNAYVKFNLTLSGAVTLTFTNLPTGDNVKVVEVMIDGAQTITFADTIIFDPDSDDYDGTKYNRYTITVESNIIRGFLKNLEDV